MYLQEEHRWLWVVHARWASERKELQNIILVLSIAAFRRCFQSDFTSHTRRGFQVSHSAETEGRKKNQKKLVTRCSPYECETSYKVEAAQGKWLGSWNEHGWGVPTQQGQVWLIPLTLRFCIQSCLGHELLWVTLLPDKTYLHELFTWLATPCPLIWKFACCALLTFFFLLSLSLFRIFTYLLCSTPHFGPSSIQSFFVWRFCAQCLPPFSSPAL